jgi:hypothetical protein
VARDEDDDDDEGDAGVADVGPTPEGVALMGAAAS